mgnify:CR=1 FL=1
MDSKKIEKIAREELCATTQFLMEMIRRPSTSGNERDVMEYIADEFAPWVDKLDKITFPADFTSDPEYSTVLEGLDYSDRYNIRAVIGDDGAAGPKLIFNAHTAGWTATRTILRTSALASVSPRSSSLSSVSRRCTTCSRPTTSR